MALLLFFLIFVSQRSLALHLNGAPPFDRGALAFGAADTHAQSEGIMFRRTRNTPK